MRALRVQIHPGRITGGDPKDMITRLRDTADGVHLRFVGEDRGEGNGLYINLKFSAPDHASGWLCLRDAYDKSAGGRQLALSTIAICEGEHGWDDYLLLHHFDPDEVTEDVGR
jgi:hypothetical protein